MTGNLGSSKNTPMVPQDLCSPTHTYLLARALATSWNRNSRIWPPMTDQLAIGIGGTSDSSEGFHPPGWLPVAPPVQPCSLYHATYMNAKGHRGIGEPTGQRLGPPSRILLTGMPHCNRLSVH